MATREVSVLQDGEPLLVAFASFHLNGDQPDVAGAAPDVPPPDDMPLLQHWVHELPAELQDRDATGSTSHRRSTCGSPRRRRSSAGRRRARRARTGCGSRARSATCTLLHAALLAYASDFFLMDMIFRAHPAESGPGSANGIQRRPRHLVPPAGALRRVAPPHPGGADDRRRPRLARGDIHDHDGRLVATVMQEVLMRLCPRR